MHHPSVLLKPPVCIKTVTFVCIHHLTPGQAELGSFKLAKRSYDTLNRHTPDTIAGQALQPQHVNESFM